MKLYIIPGPGSTTGSTTSSTVSTASTTASAANTTVTTTAGVPPAGESEAWNSYNFAEIVELQASETLKKTTQLETLQLMRQELLH